MPAKKDNRLHDTGDVVGDLEVTAASYQEDDNGTKYNFNYTFRPVADMEAERKAEADRLAAQEEDAAASEADEEPVAQEGDVSPTPEA